MLCRLCFLVGVLLLSFPSHAIERKLHIAVAANFAKPLSQVISEFAHSHKVTVHTTVGASGVLYSQIVHGAPYDLFLSADTLRPAALVTSGLIPADNIYSYAEGRLAVVGKVTSLNDLLQLGANTRMAIADPKLAPYGQATKQVLESLGLWQGFKGALVRGKNIQQTLQFWQTGNVDVAFVAASQCIHFQFDCEVVDKTLHQPIIQQLAILPNAKSTALAREFVQFLLGVKTQQALSQLGYAPVLANPPSDVQQRSDVSGF